MLTAENEMDFCLYSPNQTGEHSNLSNVFLCVPLSVIFVVAIICCLVHSLAGYP